MRGEADLGTSGTSGLVHDVGDMARARGHDGEAGSNIPGESTRKAQPVGERSAAVMPGESHQNVAAGAQYARPDVSVERVHARWRDASAGRKVARGIGRLVSQALLGVAWQVGGDELRARGNAALRVRRYFRIGTGRR